LLQKGLAGHDFDGFQVGARAADLVIGQGEFLASAEGEYRVVFLAVADAGGADEVISRGDVLEAESTRLIS